MKSGAKDGKRYTTTRTLYKDVKKFDHAQFDNFCTGIYLEGFKAGKASVEAMAVDAKAVMEAVGAVKGIGEKRMALIGAAINALFQAGTGEVEQ